MVLSIVRTQLCSSLQSDALFLAVLARYHFRHVSMCPQAGSWKRAMMLLTEMYVQGMRPAGFAVAATIRACSSAGEWRKGLEVLRQSQQVKPSKPDPCSLGAAIEMCCRAGELVSDVACIRSH